MESSLERNDELKKCPICGKSVEALFSMSASDVQRTKDPDILACAQCREELRSAARLEVKYHTPTLLRDFTITLLVGLVTVILLADFLFAYHAYSLSRLEEFYLALVLVGFTGSSQIWTGIRYRYAFTHNLRWALRSRRAVVGIGLLASCLTIGLLSIYISL